MLLPCDAGCTPRSGCTSALRFIPMARVNLRRSYERSALNSIQTIFICIDPDFRFALYMLSNVRGDGSVPYHTVRVCYALCIALGDPGMATVVRNHMQSAGHIHKFYKKGVPCARIHRRTVFFFFNGFEMHINNINVRAMGSLSHTHKHNKHTPARTLSMPFLNLNAAAVWFGFFLFYGNVIGNWFL